MLTDSPQWIAVYTNSRAEKRVADRLTENDIENYLPLRKAHRKWSDRIKIVEVPLINSYLFARITKRQVAPLRAIDGVAWLVAFRGDIATIPDEQIETMRQFVESQEQIAVIETAQLKMGATVTITDGVFEGRKGTIISDCKEGNFAIRIDALSLSLVVNIDKNLLRPSKPEKRPKGIWEQD